MKTFKSSERGSVLVIVPVFFVAIALFMAATIREGETKEFYGDLRTEAKMERVQKALAAYSHRNYRIPCPADPTIDPTTAAFGDEKASCDAAPADQIGVVPFRVLGLTEFDVRDSWGNYFTYSVSPGFTRQPLVVPGVIPNTHYVGDVAPPQPLPMPLKTNLEDNPAPYNANTTANRDAVARSLVHSSCRQSGSWMEGDAGWHRGQDGTQYDFKTTVVSGVNFAHSLNKNNYKAQFCCSSTIPTYSYMVTQDFAKGTAPTCGTNPIGTYGCGPFTNTWLWDNPSGPEDITFRLSGAARSPNRTDQWGGNGNCGAYGSRAPGSAMAWSSAQHGEKGGLSSTGFSLQDTNDDGIGDEYVSKIASRTLYMNVGGTGIKNMTVNLADLEGEEPNGKFRYSARLIDKTTGQVITNPTPPPPCPLNGAVDPNIPWWPNVSNTLWHFEAPLSTGGVTNGVGHFPIGTDNFLNHPDANVRSDFNAQLTAMGINPDNVTMQQVHVHADYTSTMLTGIDFPVPNALDNDLIVQSETGGSYMPPRGNTGYGPADAGSVGGANPLGAQAPAYTLVSHGANGAGAFIVGTNNQLPTAGAGADEIENADNNDRVFRHRRRVSAPGTNAHFDDIVMWDTQMSLYNVLPNGTCEAAQSEVN